MCASHFPKVKETISCSFYPLPPPFPAGLSYRGGPCGDRGDDGEGGGEHLPHLQEDRQQEEEDTRHQNWLVDTWAFVVTPIWHGYGVSAV